MGAINNRAFNGCTALEEVNIGDGLTEIGLYAFHGCSALSKVKLPAGLEKIETYAFYNCSVLTSINWPESITQIDASAFAGCKSLTHVELSPKLTKMGGSVFEKCTGITSVTIHDGCAILGNSAFADCTSLTNIDIPGSVGAISNRAFNGCTALEEVSIGDGVTEIGMYVFNGCSNLLFVDIGETLTKIGNFAFNGCKILNQLTLRCSAAPTVEASTFSQYETTLNIPSKLISEYTNHSIWGKFQQILPISATLTLTLAEDIHVEDYAGLKFILSNKDARSSQTISKAHTYKFFGLQTDAQYSISLCNTYGHEVKLKDVTLSSVDNEVAIDKLPAVYDVTAFVTDYTGKDLTKHTTLKWSSENGNALTEDRVLRGVPVGEQLQCQAVLDDVLVGQFEIPDIVHHKVIAGNNAVEISLKMHEKKTLTGTVETDYGPARNAVVNVLQWINGQHSVTAATETDDAGRFALKLFNDSTQVTISYTGFANARLTWSNLGDTNDLGTIRLEQVKGTVIVMNTKFVKASAEGHGEGCNALPGEVKYEMQNQSNGLTIKDYVQEGWNIVIPTGAAPGDKIEITATATSEGYASDKATCTIQPNDSASATLTLYELGSIIATYDASTTDANHVLIYDETEQLKGNGLCKAKSYTFGHLPAGHYTLIAINGENVPSIQSLSTLNESGLLETAGFVIKEVDLADGQACTVNFGFIPAGENAVSYIVAEKSYLECNKPVSIAGNFVTLSAKAIFADEYKESVSNAMMVVDLPESCRLVEGSLISDVSVIPYTYENNQLIFPISISDIEERYRFCIVPTESGTQYFTASVEFDCEGQKKQIVGSAELNINDMLISVRTPFNHSPLMVAGQHSPSILMDIYDRNTLIGSAKTDQTGIWRCLCDIDTTYNLVGHDIYAVAHMPNGYDVNTETRHVIYDRNAPMPTKIDMTFLNDFNKNVYVTFNLDSYSTSKNSYVYTNPKLFTFIAHFDKEVPDSLYTVNMLIHTDGNRTIRLPATYNADGTWVASRRFYVKELPVHADVELTKEVVELEYDPKLDNKIDSLTTLMQMKHTKVSELGELHTMLFEMLVSGQYEEQQALDLLSTIVDGLSELVGVNISDELYAELQEKLLGCPSPAEFVELLEAENLTSAQSYISDQFDKSTEHTLPPIDLGNGLVLPSIELMDGTSTDNSRHGAWVYELDSIDSKIFWMKNTNTNEQVKYSIPDQYNDVREYMDAMMEHDLSNYASSFIKTGLQEDQRMLSLYNTIMYTLIKKHYTLNETELMKHSANAPQIHVSNRLADIAELVMDNVPAGVFGVGRAFLGFTNDQRKIDRGNDRWDEIVNMARERCANKPGISSILEEANRKKAVEATYRKTLMIASMTWFFVSHMYPPASMLSIIGYMGVSELQDYSEDIIDEVSRRNERAIFNQLDEKGCHLPPPQDHDPLPPMPPILPLRDPSGYVYEAVPNNRLQGVTATVYLKTEEEDMYGDKHEKIVKWDAESHDQKNPLITDAEGFYAWDVPEGWWQVKYEKEGYETTTSNWLPVPPPQLEVNQPMQQAIAPVVAETYGYSSGIKFVMSKYMRPETMLRSSVLVISNGGAVAGTLVPLNLESDLYETDKQYASAFKFVPENPLTVEDKVEFTLRKKHPESYCGIKMTDDYRAVITIMPEITAVKADSIVYVPIGDKADVKLTALPAEAARGKVVRVSSSLACIVSTEEEMVTFDANGVAVFHALGNMPGGACLTFEIDGTGIEQYVLAEVGVNVNMVEKPIASLSSGSLVEKGYKVELSCATPGAKIYYTLDGSCPCEENKGNLYTQPIVIDDNILIKAMAVKEGMEDSEIAEYYYYAYNAEALTKVSGDDYYIYAAGKSITVSHNGQDVNLKLYDMSGNVQKIAKRIPKSFSFDVPNSGIYILRLDAADNNTKVYKLLLK